MKKQNNQADIFIYVKICNFNYKRQKKKKLFDKIHNNKVLLVQMGNKALANQFKSGKWLLKENLGNRQILQNSQTHVQVQKHFAMSNFKSFQERYQNTEIYNWRKSLGQQANIIKLYEYEIKQERFGIQQDEYVYTEKINRLINKGKTYSKPQGFLLIMELLMGLDLLFEKFGLFNIDVFLVGVSLQGKGKVWVNQNFAKNFVDQNNIIQNKSLHEELVIVNNLVRLIRQRVFNQDFMPEIQFPLNMTCKQAIYYITQIRSSQFLFNVNKVYLNRNQFKQHYDKLYKEFMQKNKNSIPSFYNHNPNITHQNVSNPPINNLLYQQQKVLQKSNSFLKVKHEPSQTLSSDSNSRARKQNKTTVQVVQNEGSDKKKQKIHIQEMIQKQNLIQQKVSRKLSQIQFSQVQEEKKGINLQNKRKKSTQIQHIRQFIQPNKLQHNFVPGPFFIQQRNINTFQHPPAVNQFVYPQMTNYGSINVDQRRLVPNNVVEASNQYYKQPFYIVKQGPYTPYTANQPPFIVIQEPRQNFVKQNGQFQRAPVHGPPVMVQKRVISNPQQFYAQNCNPRENFIEDVELCESVMLDRGQLQRNLADLDK